MNILSKRIYIVLIILLAVLSAISVYLPQGSFLPAGDLPASKFVIALINILIMFIIYGGLGFIGIRLSVKLGFPEIWDEKITSKERFIIPAYIGAGTGGILILLDIIFSNYNSFGRLPHPPFPTSLIASITAGISEELIFRLFFISFWVWLIYYKILKRKYKKPVFWIVVVFSSIVFTISHFPSIMYLTGVKTISGLSNVMIIELFLMNGLVSFFAAYFFKKYGFLAAVGIHFWTDIVWHVVWGLL